MSKKEPWIERRRDRDNYINHPSYLHPLYGTPLREPYKRLKKQDDIAIEVVSKGSLDSGSPLRSVRNDRTV